MAQAEIDGQWRPCTFPGPLIAVTHSGAGREVTLGEFKGQADLVLAFFCYAWGGI